MSPLDALPVRNLGAGEDWGRQVENRLKSLTRGIKIASETVGNLERRKNSQNQRSTIRLEQLSGLVDRLGSQNEELSSRIGFGEWQANLTPGAFGEYVEVEAPPGYVSGAVIVGMSMLSNPKTGWGARVDVFAENYVPNSSLIGGLRAVAVGGIHGANATSDPGYAYQVDPAIRALGSSSSLFIRPIGVQVDGGSTSVVHQVLFHYVVIWIKDGG